MIQKLLLLFLVFSWACPSFAQSQLERGKLTDGNPVGVWEYFDDFAGKELGLRFNYDSARINYVRPDTSRYFVLVDSSWQIKRLNRAPRLIGSRANMVDAIQRKLRYPPQDLRAHRSGTVIVTCVVDAQGKVGLPVVISTPSPTLAQEVLRALDELPLYYIPGVYRAKRVQTKISFVARFCIASSYKQTDIQSEMKREVERQTQVTPSPPGSFDEVIVTGLGVR